MDQLTNQIDMLDISANFQTNPGSQYCPRRKYLEFWGISHILLILPSDTSWKWTQRRTKGIISKLPQNSFRWRIPTLTARFKTAIFLGWARLSPHRKITETKYHWHTRSVRPPGRHVKSIHIRPFYGPFNFSFVEKISSTHANQIWVSPRYR